MVEVKQGISFLGLQKGALEEETLVVSLSEEVEEQEGCHWKEEEEEHSLEVEGIQEAEVYQITGNFVAALMKRNLDLSSHCQDRCSRRSRCSHTLD